MSARGISAAALVARTRVDGTAIELGKTPLRIVQTVVVALAVLHLVHLSLSGVFMDEAYYWMWGQHPALSYYDHPALNGWLLGLSSLVFGWNFFALRLPVALAFLADFIALYLFARRIAGDRWQEYFWLTALLFVGTPIFWMVTVVAIPDHLLLTTCLFAIYFFYRFFADRSAQRPGASRDLYLGALVLGLAGLTKYNAAFLGLGVGIFVLLVDRRLLREPRLYLAAGLALLIQAPTVVWNVTQHFASFEFTLHDRHAGLSQTADGLYPFIVSLLIFVSPFLFWPMARFATARRSAVPGMGFARTTFLVSTVTITVLAFSTLTLFHWNLVAYTAMLPFLVVYMRPRVLLILQATYGVVFAVLVFINYSVVPLTDVNGWRDEATAWSYGWNDVARAVETARQENPVSFVAAADYTTASLLGFALHDRNVTSLSARTEAYDFWINAGVHPGADAILYGDRWRPLTEAIKRRFQSVTELTTVDTIVAGRQLNTAHLYLARGFNG